jgi:RNA polymerase sigma-70 factor (ECF subfamily)
MDQPELPEPAATANSRPQPQPLTDRDVDRAFSAFYRDFIRTLVAFLLSQGARLPEAADIAQDTMIKARNRWRRLTNPQAWTRTVAARELVRRTARTSEDPVDHLPETTPLLRSPTAIDTWEQRHDILRLLARLPARQRQVMAWTLDGYKPSEIARELRIEPSAVRASLGKARLRLATLLAGMEGCP